MRHKSIGLLAGVTVAVLLSQPSIAWAQAGPNLAIAMSHSGNFTVGENGVYTIVVSNIGGTATGGTMLAGVYLLLNGSGVPVPGMPSFGFVSSTGTGWSCYEFYGFPAYWIEVRCISTSVIAAGGSASPLFVTVNPYGLSGTVTNTARVGLCTPDLLTCTNVHTANDPTIVVAAVPSLPEWAMIVLTGLLALAGVAALRRRTT
jgi:hypothetical protein